MRRGFKAEAERRAASVRKEMGKRPSEYVPAAELARYAGAEIRAADELTSLTKLETLEELQPGAFSACTFTIGNRHIVVYSPLASPGRTQSDITHEVAHLLLEHSVKSVETIAGVSFFTCDEEEEQEANWLAGCLLLPRPLLLAAARRGMSSSAIADTYGVSENMAAFRLRTTGVERQIAAGRSQR
jgi:hypothetical protein